MRALDQLVQYKREFGRGAARRIQELLKHFASLRLREPTDLIRLHEAALFFRAFPQSPRIALAADKILFTFAGRLRDIDPEPFDDPLISGIAGTTVSTNFSHPFARRLVERHGSAVQIDWENYPRPDRLGSILGHALRRELPMAYDAYAVEPHVDWRAWFERGRCSLAWLLDTTDPRTYDLLEIPVRWDLGDSSASRSRLRLQRAQLFYHASPLLKRSDVSIEAEFSKPSIPTRRLLVSGAQTILNKIVEASASRYRELYGFENPDPKRVDRADLGRGVDLFLFGVPRNRRLHLRAYHCGMFFKNGVPMGYFEGLSLRERLEIGLNIYPTFRESETAWVYARILKLLRQQLGVTCFSVHPYQLGHENEEGLASGAFWFYRKLGFRPASEEAARLMAREETKIAANPSYRTPPAMLRRLVVAPLVYRTRESAC